MNLGALCSSFWFASNCCCQVPEGGELLQDGTVRINVWASPRSLSTALMYSFAQVGIYATANGLSSLCLFLWFELLLSVDLQYVFSAAAAVVLQVVQK